MAMNARAAFPAPSPSGPRSREVDHDLVRRARPPHYEGRRPPTTRAATREAARERREQEDGTAPLRSRANEAPHLTRGALEASSPLVRAPFSGRSSRCPLGTPLASSLWLRLRSKSTAPLSKCSTCSMWGSNSSWYSRTWWLRRRADSWSCCSCLEVVSRLRSKSTAPLSKSTAPLSKCSTCSMCGSNSSWYSRTTSWSKRGVPDAASGDDDGGGRCAGTGQDASLSWRWCSPGGAAWRWRLHASRACWRAAPSACVPPRCVVWPIGIGASWKCAPGEASNVVALWSSMCSSTQLAPSALTAPCEW